MSNDKKKNVKNTRLQFRFDNETLNQLDECARVKETNRSEIVRQGIKKIHSELKKWVSNSTDQSELLTHHTPHKSNFYVINLSYHKRVIVCKW